MKVVQPADNVKLYRWLLDLSAKALDMQTEIEKLKKENAELKKKKIISDKIICHKEVYISMNGEERTIQLIVGSNGTLEYPHCHVKGIYNEEKRKQIAKRQAEAIVNRTIKSRRSRNVLDLHLL